MNTKQALEGVMRDRTATIALLGASAVSAMLLGAASEAHADSLTFDNASDASVSFVYAEPDQSCPSGMRDGAWFNLSPHERTNVDVNTSGSFFLAAVTVIPVNPPIWESIGPVVGEVAGRWWSPPKDSSSAGQCSDIRPLDDDPNAGLWHSEWNLGNSCLAGGRPGVQVRPNANSPEQTLEVGVFCFGGPSNPGGAGDPGNPDQF